MRSVRGMPIVAGAAVSGTTGRPHRVESLKPNAFGLHDMGGNGWRWVQDCYHDDYNGAPPDGSAWTSGDCNARGIRGGSWFYKPQDLRSATRQRNATGARNYHFGFRLGRTLSP